MPALLGVVPGEGLAPALGLSKKLVILSPRGGAGFGPVFFEPGGFFPPALRPALLVGVGEGVGAGAGAFCFAFFLPLPFLLLASLLPPA